MVAVKGIYQGGDTVKLDYFSLLTAKLPAQPVEPYEVVVSFVKPVQKFEKAEINNERRREAFQNFMQHSGTLPADFDYKKELNDYRDERYGHID